MGEQISVPIGDSTFSQWNIQPGIPPTHYDKIDEDWVTPNIFDYIHETVNGQRDDFSFPADGPTEMVTVHTVYVDLYINTTDVGQIPGLVIFIFSSGVFKGAESYKIDTGGTWQKRRFTVTGLSLTKAEYNAMTIGLFTSEGLVGWPTPEVIE